MFSDDSIKYAFGYCTFSTRYFEVNNNWIGVIDYQFNMSNTTHEGLTLEAETICPFRNTPVHLPLFWLGSCFSYSPSLSVIIGLFFRRFSFD